MRPSDGPTTVQMGKGVTKVEGMGEVILPLLNPKSGMVSKKMLKLKNVLYVPGFHINLLAHKRFDENGCHHRAVEVKCTCTMRRTSCCFGQRARETMNFTLLGLIHPSLMQRMIVEEPTMVADSNAVISDKMKSTNETLLYHHCLAHLSEKAVQKMLTEGI